MPGFLGALIAKLVGRTVAKAALATTTALTMVVGGGAAAGIIPTGGDANPVAVAQPAVDQAGDAADAALDLAPPAPPVDAVVPADDEASEMPPTASASADAGAAAATPSVSPATNLDEVPDVSDFETPELSAQPDCVTGLIPTGGSVPDPARLVAELPTCILSVVTANLPLDLIEQAIDSADLPVDISGCLSSVLASLPTFVGGDLSALSAILSACLPAGAIPGSEAGSGSFPGFGSDFGSDFGR
jgi:hypothetical protein